ncbi:MAG: methyltransferase domain-containing protein [Rhodocyclaceae bacterium]|nr:methyltransferase domain-containing protein [Rhodocyclaceae bacterium]
MTRELYRADQLPVFQNRMFRTAEMAHACARGDMVLVQDPRTGLVFNDAFRPELMHYDADYQNEQAVSSVFRTHLDEITGIVERHFRGRSLIEVGCGKAYFLEHLQELGYAITGIDPAYEGDNPRVIKARFSRETGLRAEGLILRHVLEHIQQPADFLAALREANGGGTIFIEVPCLDWICSHRAWFDIFYEHVNYFRLDDFRRLFGRIHESGHVFGGQYLYVVADLASLRDTAHEQVERFDFPADFAASIGRFADRIRARGATAVVWGGASKGVIFSLFMQRAGAGIDCVVDINPAKQGRYLPATGLRVSSPGEMLTQVATGADIYVMNGNYLAEIRRMTQDKFNYMTVDHE